ncbi:hypothetical protein BGX27_003294 [Mortierella sp. AM989]|nr:hypothetical protein BGX27_003294 [Mortierella sp. AM989]
MFYLRKIALKSSPHCFWSNQSLSFDANRDPQTKFSLDRTIFIGGKALSYGVEDQIVVASSIFCNCFFGARSAQERAHYLDRIEQGWSEGIAWADKAIQKLQQGYDIDHEKRKKWTPEWTKKWKTFVYSKKNDGKDHRIEWNQWEWRFFMETTANHSLVTGQLLGPERAHIDRIFNSDTYCIKNCILVEGGINYAKATMQEFESSESFHGECKLEYGVGILRKAVLELLAQSRPHRSGVKGQLLDDDSKQLIDTLIPPEAVNMLHARLSGRFRPVVLAIEGIIRTGDPNKWESIIDNTEDMLSSWKDKERRGNIIGEILRTSSKMAKHPDQFTSCSSIEETLQLFLYRWFILGETRLILEDEAQLVEAALGRIKMLDGNAKVTLDEPFVLRATINYFRQKDPDFVATAERFMLSSTNASVHGNMWETKAISTTSSIVIQTKIDKEQEKKNHKRIQELCPSGLYISMVIAYPAEVISFQAYRPDPDPELRPPYLDRVMIKIDNNNFPDIFPWRHVKFLDYLKNFKKRPLPDDHRRKAKIARSTSGPL